MKPAPRVLDDVLIAAADGYVSQPRCWASGSGPVLRDPCSALVILETPFPGKLRDLPDCDLANAGSPALTGMAGLYEAVRQALSADTVKNPNARVTASKLCARKGPDLLPVRDTEVCDYLAALDGGTTRWTGRSSGASSAIRTSSKR